MKKDSIPAGNQRIAVADIGGTCIKSGVWENNELREIRTTDTNASLGGRHVVETVIDILSAYGDFQALGISTAGQVDSEKGEIIYANTNIPGYTGMKVREILENRFAVPAAVENDVNSAAMGEAFFGAGRGHASFLCLTYGTGVGGAIVADGRIYTGSRYAAGEFGGIIVHPEDRAPEHDMYSGCYERYASTTALVRSVSAHFPELRNGREIFARLEDEKVRVLIDRWIAEMVLGLVSLTHIFNPSLIIVGGGVMEQPYVVEEIRRQLKKQLIPSFLNVEIVPSQLGNKAGLFGAVKAAQTKVLNRP